ncbi:MAG: hypothetical protein WCM76_09110 [Bacteroidota bacterium]
MKIPRISLCIILLLTFGCKTVRYTNHSITLGRGGGFIGKYDSYTLKGNGEVFSTNAASAGSAPVSLSKKLDKKTVADLFSKAAALQFPNPEFNHPGNMTYYIEYFDGKQTHTIKWGDFNLQPPISFKAFFDETWKTVKN